MINTNTGSGHGRKGESGRRIKRGMDREYGNIGKRRRGTKEECHKTRHTDGNQPNRMKADRRNKSESLN